MKCGGLGKPCPIVAEKRFFGLGRPQKLPTKKRAAATSVAEQDGRAGAEAEAGVGLGNVGGPR